MKAFILVLLTATMAYSLSLPHGSRGLEMDRPWAFSQWNGDLGQKIKLFRNPAFSLRFGGTIPESTVKPRPLFEPLEKTPRLRAPIPMSQWLNIRRPVYSELPYH